ncbi:phosphotransferase (plasmid) [Kitasatospora sp. NBC_00070]|uniref:phosphotransferase n=1 Tax=Kitasatospora sp. NBC_00070 TaxID=2975962 RepID=UPI002F90AB45
MTDPVPAPDTDEVVLTGGGGAVVSRRGDVVLREASAWSSTMQALLRHLEAVGFAGAPMVVGSGFDDAGREMITFVEGGFVHPGPWEDDAVGGLGVLLRGLHDATASFRPPEGAVWRPWYGRSLGGPERVIGHCDTGPWNIVARQGRPAALIDWEFCGPVDPLVELAQMCWLNAQLHDDDVAERAGLPPAGARARQLRAIVDGYGLSAGRRRGFLDTVIEVAVQDAADQASEAGVTPESTDAEPLWGITWRLRSAAWMMRNRALLERALH